MKKLKQLEDNFKNRSKGCLICGTTPIKLPMNYKILYAFGGAYITRNGKTYYFPDNWDGTKLGLKKHKTLMTFELKARKNKADWRLVNDVPLHDEVYQRQGKNNWVLVKKGIGFA